MNDKLEELIAKCDDNYCIITLRKIGSAVGSRDLISYLFDATRKEKLILDFTGIEFISRGFADELYSMIVAGRIIPINMGEDVKKMLQIVEKSRKSDFNKP